MTCFQDSIGLAHSLDLTQHDFFSVQLASLLVISNFDAIATFSLSADHDYDCVNWRLDDVPVDHVPLDLSIVKDLHVVENASADGTMSMHDVWLCNVS